MPFHALPRPPTPSRALPRPLPLAQVRPSVSPKELEAFEDWNRMFGSFASQASKAEAG